MKRNRFLSWLFAFTALTVFFTSCEDDAIKPVLDLTGGTFVSAEFTSSGTATLTLAFENANMEVEKLEWSAADFGVQLPVKYTVEMSAAGDFSDAFVMGTTSTTSLSITDKDFNDAVLATWCVRVLTLLLLFDEFDDCWFVVS